ncbi:ribose 5-phosphate isomerase B [Deferribacteraceae bacterium V6Fe1]|nr:ribose 5-phosphate isomerase B [Deferribacteraceae bacterium V6Fe1]
MKIGLASDHGGFELKEIIKKFLYEKGLDVVDYGTSNGDESVDYPDYAKKAVLGILDKEVERAVIMCGSGIGISISANKFPGIRAALCWDSYTAKMSRLHNDANVLAMGGRIIGPELAKEIVETWLSYDFEGGRHQRRIDKIDSLAKEYWNNIE